MKKKNNPISENSALDLSEMERLRKDVFRPDMEKLQLFSKMLRTNATLKKAKISHK